MKVIKAPEDWSRSAQPLVFAAGSIEMGAAEDWQARLAEMLEDVPGTYLNPRRDHWDPTWPYIPTHPPLQEQVHWELEGLEAADIVLFYFDPLTKSAIALLELGLVAERGSVLDKRVAVCCPPDFHRYANVALTCEYYSLSMVPDLDSLATWLRRTLESHLHSA